MRHSLTRRQVLQLGLGLAALPLAVACGQPSTPAAPKTDAKPAAAQPTAAQPTVAAKTESKPAESKPAAQPTQAVPATAKPAAEQKPAAEPKPASRTPAGELKVALPAKLTTLDPQGAQSVDGVTHSAMQHVFDTLVTRDEASGGLAPKLATSWEAPDASTWVFKIRQGVKFHDGSALTANDAKVSLERIIAQKGPVAPLFAAVETVEAPDDATLRLKMKQPVGTIPASTALLTVGPAAQINGDGFFSKPIGSGPFKFVSWRADADLRLEANDQYWGGPPAAKTLVLRHIPEIAARVTALETGEIDLTWVIPPDQLAALQANADLKVETTPSHQYYFMWFNSSREPFTDKRVRQAMIYALDTDTMVKDLLQGVGQKATAPIPPTVFGHAAQTPYSYDPAKAKQLLAEAGHPNGFETSFIWYAGAGPQDRELGQAMISYWNAVGVRVKVAEQERATWLDNLIKLNWDMDFQTNAVTTGDADFTLGRLYHSRANRNGYKNADLDKLLDDAVAATDQNVRKDLYAKANKHIWDEAVGIFPFDLLATFAHRKNVEGFMPTPSAFLNFYNAAPKR